MGERALENRIKKLKALEEQKKALETQIEGLLGGDDIIEKTFKGPIQQQLRDALQYIRNVVITEKVIKYPDRAESDRFFNYPYAAIEEALSNAVYHRAYDEREPIEVRVENDRIEIVSFPGPDRSVTIEDLKCFRVSNRRYRNRRIGDFLKELHLTEGRNTVYQTNISSYVIDDKTKIARGMAYHFLISGILLCIFGVISLLFAGLMLLARSYAGAIDELSYEPKAYTFAMIFYIILAIVGFSWAIARFVGRGKIMKTNRYSANGVITSSVTLCAVFILRIITNLNLDNAYGIFFCLLLVGIIIYEIIGIIIYAFIHRDVYVIEVHNALDDIPEYVEEPSKWGEILKTEYIEPIDETEDLYSRYMDYRKDRLVEILDKPNDYQEIAVKVARYVYYKRFCNTQE